MDTTTTTADMLDGFQHAEEVSARRDNAIGKPFTEDEKIIAACAFAKGALKARKHECEALMLLNQIVSIVDLMLATGNTNLPISMTPPPFWLSEARDLLAKRNGGCRMSKESWIVKVQFPEKRVMWFGNFMAAGRQDAKREARIFVSACAPESIRILAIARGAIAITKLGDEISMEDEV